MYNYSNAKVKYFSVKFHFYPVKPLRVCSTVSHRRRISSPADSHWKKSRR